MVEDHKSKLINTTRKEVQTMFNSMKSLRKMRTFFGPNDVGFTLVELLIVIVIIGILAGVVIGVLNPVQQQNRARDSVARAQLDKMALSTKGLFVSSPRSSNRSPSGTEFISGIGSVVDPANCNLLTAVDNTAGSCVYQM